MTSVPREHRLQILQHRADARGFVERGNDHGQARVHCLFHA